MFEDKVILLDVDGVLADFVNAILKASGTDLKSSDIDDWDLFSMMKPHHRERALKALEDKSFWRNLPVMPKAKDQVELFKRNNNKILYVTSPWADETSGWKCESWGAARAEWLREHFGASYKDMIICYDKKYVRGDVFIDDRYKNILEWSSNNEEGQAWLVSHPYNKSLYWSHKIIMGSLGWEFIER